jgi:hypothetical protein
LENGKNEIQVDAEIGRRAKLSIQRMLDFAKGLNLSTGLIQAPGTNKDGVGPA